MISASTTNRATNIWNSLPNCVVLSDTVYTFKNKLDKIWQYLILKLKFKEPETEAGIRY